MSDKGAAGLQTAMDNRSAAPAKVENTFPKMLEKFLPEIKRALPAHLNGDRMARIALTAFRRNKQLGNCDPRSVMSAVIQASQLGLEIDTMGRAYLVPYGNECQFIPGWKGLVDLMNRAKEGTVFTGIIYEGQKFKYTQGDRPSLTVESYEGEEVDENIAYAYAVGWVKDAAWPVIELWSVDKIKRHRDKYNKVGQRHYSFKNWEMYARKVVLLQVLKYMPCSAEMTRAIELNNDAETVGQKLDLSDAIQGEYVREQTVEQPEPGSDG